MRPVKPQTKGPRVNRQIRTESVRLVDENGEMLGIIDLDEALRRAEAAGMDLVEVSPNADPPVCKILDYGKYKYEAQKKANEARKKQKVVHLKEVKLRPNIDTHDYDVKLRHVNKFLDAGDKVKISIRFRGREMAHQELGMELMHKVKEATEEKARVDHHPRMEGRQMIMILSPK